MRVVITLEDGHWPDVTVTDGLAMRHFETTPEVLADLLLDASDDHAPLPWTTSPLLPPHAVFWGQQGPDTTALVLDMPAGPQPWVLPTGETAMTAQVIPLPRLLFLFILHRQYLRHMAVVALATDDPLTPTTPLFAYPLSNVYNNTTVCWSLPDQRYTVSDLPGLAHAFLATPNNWDLTEQRNASGLDYRALGDALAHRPAFPSEWLLPLHRTWHDWLTDFVPQAELVADTSPSTPREV